MTVIKSQLKQEARGRRLSGQRSERELQQLKSRSSDPVR